MWIAKGGSRKEKRKKNWKELGRDSTRRLLNANLRKWEIG